MLNNDSVDKVKDYTGDDQIGSISFTKATDLITTKDILQKATDNLNFQIDLYELLKREIDKDRRNRDIFGFYDRDRDDRSYQYGLSQKAEDYEHGSTRITAMDDNFFRILFRRNFWIGLNWAINFVNNAVSSLLKINEGCLSNYEINFIEDNIKRSYWGSPEMWLVTTEEYRMPMIISDLIYCLKEELASVIENDAVVNKETAKFATNVSNLICDNSNNIALLTIISDIGMKFCQKLPGYALDLTTNIDIILHDLTRLSGLKNPISQMFEKQILMMRIKG